MSDNSLSDSIIKAHIEFEEKNMKAFIVLKDFGIELSHITEEEISILLTQSGIKYGIKNEIIREIVDEKKKSGRFLIAEGTLPSKGEDARFEFNFETDKSFRPKILDDGHIDYKDVSLVKSVAKDTILIRKIIAKPGIEGMDVLGKVLPAIHGQDYNITNGQGTYKDPIDSSLVKAAADGIIYYDENKRSIEVQKLYFIEKSVDYSTGNINVKSSVDIKGDVKPHFTVTTPYNVQVKGLVENAVIKCGGSLSVNGGIVGDGKQLIETGGDIHSSYINNQHIKCHGSVIVSSEIRNTIIDCDDEVVLVKNTGVIIGGKISATNKITAASIGNSYYVPTEIAVGMKLALKDKYVIKENEIKAMLKLIEEIKNEMSGSNQNLSDTVNTSYMEGLYLRWNECNEKLEILKKELKEIEVDYYTNTDSIISVSKTIYPGTIIRIKQACFEVKDELSHVKFKLENGFINYTNL